MKKAGSVLKKILLCLAVGAPVLLCIGCQLSLLIEFRYPHLAFDSSILFPCLLFTLIGLLPTILWGAGWLAWFRWGKNGVIQAVLAVFCVLWLPVTLVTQCLVLFGSPVYSETDKPAHYMKLDDYVAENGQLLSFFPAEPGDEALRYYYRYGANIDAEYEVYAEWTLSPDGLAAEIQRVEALMAAHPDYMTMERTQRGPFQLLMCYSGSPPFEDGGRSYTHMIFAWDEETGLVRYIYSDGLDNYEPLAYLALEW